MHFTDAAVFPRLVWTARTAGKGISIGTDVMSSFFSIILKKTYFMYKILHAVIYLIFCIFSLNLFIVRIVFLLHAVIFFLHVVLLLFVEIKALLGLCYMFVNIRQKIKFLCLCLCLLVKC